MNLPEFIMVNLGDTCNDLHAVIDNSSYPTIDFDVVMEKIIDCLLHHPTVNGELSYLHTSLFTHEILNENFLHGKDVSIDDSIDDQVLNPDIIVLTAYHVGQMIHKHFRDYKLYVEDILHYEYSKMDNHGQILYLRRRGNV